MQQPGFQKAMNHIYNSFPNITRATPFSVFRYFFTDLGIKNVSQNLPHIHFERVTYKEETYLLFRHFGKPYFLWHYEGLRTIATVKLWLFKNAYWRDLFHAKYIFRP